MDRSDGQGSELRALPEEERRRLRLVRGHMLFGMHEWLPGPATYITMLRHPVGHVRSQYWYYQEEGTAWAEKSIQEMLRNDDSVWLDNQQVRKLSGRGNQKKNCGREDFERARANLETHFAVVGLVERFDESLVLMKERLRWRRPLFYRAANVNSSSRRKKNATPDLRELILKTNRWDVKLYEYAEERFKEHVQEHEGRLEDEVEKLHRANRIFGPALAMWRRIRSFLRREHRFLR